MSRSPLHVMVLWHMHQPFYRSVQAPAYRMPWVFLHGLKDYLDMPLLAAEFPRARVTFNMTPCLLEQIDDYASGRAVDPYIELAERRAEDLNDEEKLRLLETFFNANEEHMIRPHPRYRELRKLLGSARGRNRLHGVLDRFNTADLRDLQTWFFLAWIDPMHRVRYPHLARLVDKDRFFTESEKTSVLATCRQILGEVVPTLRRLWEEDRIEISTSAYFHPILPLLIDTDIGARPRPETGLPRRSFRHPDDARDQIEMGLADCERRFGRRPAGLWPSEGSVCPELIPLLGEAGVAWAASDEGILARSLGMEGFARDGRGRLADPDRLCRPWRVEHEGGSTVMFFRDRMLSDQIGFHYANMPAEEAVADLVGHLEAIDASLEGHEGPHVVSLVLDGENCWEYYEEDGAPFLRGFYEAVTSHKRLEMVTPSQYLARTPEPRTLPQLASGSWINQDYSIWLGAPEKNASWDLLAQTREALEPFLAGERKARDPERLALARKAVQAAEGSDWNWWYGEPNSTSFDALFDALYRQHLAAAWHALDLEPPGRLHIPVADPGLLDVRLQPRGFLSPQLDGRITSYFEWFAAGHFDPRRAGDAMHRAHGHIAGLYFGFDPSTLWLRIDPTPELFALIEAHAVELVVVIISDGHHRLSLPLAPGRASEAVRHIREENEQGWVESGAFSNYACNEIVELGLAFADFGIDRGKTLGLQVAVHIDDEEVERSPMRMPLETQVPNADFEESMWTV